MTLKIGWTYRWTDLPWLVGTAAVYALLSKIILTFYSANGLVSVFWPGSGVALAAILLGGRKFWVGIYAGALAGRLWAGESVEVASFISIGSVLEPLIGAWLLSREGEFDVSLRSARQYMRLCYLAAALSPCVGAAIGAGTLLLSGHFATDAFWHEFARWWMGDTLGIVVVAPLLMVWRRPPRRQPWNVPEAVALFGLSFLLGQIVFFDWFSSSFGSMNRGYWMYLVASWAAARLGRHGVLAVVLLTTVQALAGAAQGKGYFGDDLAATQLTNFWGWTMILATVSMSLATLLSERKRAEDGLRKLSLAVLQSPVSIVITDLEGRIEYVNPAFSQISGYSAEEARGQNPRLLKSNRTPRETYQELWATLAAGKVWRGEFINRRKDGTEYVEAATISPLRQTDGRVTHYVGVKEDITAFGEAMAELRLSETRLRLAKTAAGLGIIDWDLVNGKGEWDERTREIRGVGPDEPITLATVVEDAHPDDRMALEAAIERALDPLGTGEYNAEYRVISRTDGGVRHVVVNGRAFFEGGRAVRLVGTMRDVSAQKRQEMELQERRREMEVLMKQQVAAQTAVAIAHELNQPLISISAYSEAALRMLRHGVKNPEKLAHALVSAVEQTQRAGRTLHELIEFLHKGEVVSEPVDLNEVVREALAIAAESGCAGFRPVIGLEPDLPPVLANRLQLQKVLVNLLYNGVEAMRDAGVPLAKITITVRTMAGRNMAQVTVQDSGPGLDAETAHRIFEPFFTTKPTGIGLGLAISRALVEAHGGQMWADMETAGSGATFHFTLPFAP